MKWIPYFQETHPQILFSECSHYCELANGFTLYMVKAVMNGHGDELVTLAVSNLWL